MNPRALTPFRHPARPNFTHAEAGGASPRVVFLIVAVLAAALIVYQAERKPDLDPGEAPPTEEEEVIVSLGGVIEEGEQAPLEGEEVFEDPTKAVPEPLEEDAPARGPDGGPVLEPIPDPEAGAQAIAEATPEPAATPAAEAQTAPEADEQQGEQEPAPTRPQTEPAAAPEPTPEATATPEPTPEATPTPKPPRPAPTLDEVARDERLWPKRVMLTKAIRLPVFFNGRIAGEAEGQVGLWLPLSSVNGERVILLYHESKVPVDAGSTNLLELAHRIAERLPEATPTPTPAAEATPIPLPGLADLPQETAEPTPPPLVIAPFRPSVPASPEPTPAASATPRAIPLPTLPPPPPTKL